MGNERIRYLDGLRGLLAVIVFVHHFLYAFCPTIIFGGTYQEFLSGNLTLSRFFALTPINIFFNPGTAINFFFLLSGYVQTYHYFKKPELLFLQKSFIKRYFRLAIPTLAVVLLLYVFHKLHLIDRLHFPPNQLSYDWIKSMLPDSLNFWQSIRYGLLDCFNSKAQVYQILWTMPVELYNSWMILILLLVIHSIKNKIPFLIGWMFVQLFLLESYYGVSFTLGAFVAHLNVNSSSFSNFFSKKWVLWLCSIVGFYFASYPFMGYESSSKQSIYRLISFFDVYPHVISYIIGNTLLFGVILYSLKLQKLLSAKWLLFFGNISFMFYLIHFLILFSFSPWLFFKLFGVFHNGVSNYIITGTSTFIVITLISYALFKLIDAPILKGCNIMTKKIYGA
jgi:peptidoglycan/LPS O-acetylase OafA/YrhL